MPLIRASRINAYETTLDEIRARPGDLDAVRARAGEARDHQTAHDAVARRDRDRARYVVPSVPTCDVGGGDGATSIVIIFSSRNTTTDGIG